MSAEKIAAVVERLRKSQADRDEAQNIAAEQRRLVDEKQRSEGLQAGRDWATNIAEIDQLENIAKMAHSEYPRRMDVIGTVCSEKSYDFRDGFAKGAHEVWSEVKDQL
jgi:hypothetical protein